MKSFTQAGNRDRHEKKKVCQKRASVGGESIGDYNSQNDQTVL